MRRVKGIFLGAILLLTTSCLSGCSTTIGSNYKIYTTQMRSTADDLLGSNSKETTSAVNEQSAGTKLDTPENFSIDEDGNYIFDSVENAAYYLIYFCDSEATDDEDTYLFSSVQIKEDGSETYSGNCAELFDYGYGDFLAKVFAFPEIGNEEYEMSSAALTEYIVEGELEAPEIYYYWDIFSGVFGIQIGNIEDYLYQVYPDHITVTMENMSGGDDIVLTLEDPSDDNYAIETTDVEQGATYRISAVAESSDDYVLSPTSGVYDAGDVTLGSNSLIVPGYKYHNDNQETTFSWPLVEESFDPEEGGHCGIWYLNLIGYYDFYAEPTDTESGALFTYELKAESSEPTVSEGGVYAREVEGTLNIYADGTFKAQNESYGPIYASSIVGTWSDNGDGTYALNWDNSSIEYIN